MRKIKIIRYLENNTIVSENYFLDRLNISQRTFKYLLQEIKQESGKNGFIIKTIREKGYRLEILDFNLFKNYKQQLFYNNDVSNKDYRIPTEIFYLLVENDYVSMQFLSLQLDVSINTIQRDMVDLEKKLEEYDLMLIKQRHKGLLLKGNDNAKRKAIFRYVICSIQYIKRLTDDIYDFDGQYGYSLKIKIMNILKEKFGLITPNQLECILNHCRVMIYCTNYAIGFQFEKLDDLKYRKIAKKIIQVLTDYTSISFPIYEVDYLSTQISSIFK